MMIRFRWLQCQASRVCEYSMEEDVGLVQWALRTEEYNPIIAKRTKPFKARRFPEPHELRASTHQARVPV